MSLFAALAYFFREALTSLRRSWKVGALAVLTIAISLFVGAGFLLVADNLGRLVEGWRQQARVVLYLAPDASPAARAELVGAARAAPWAERVEEVDPEAAAERFRRTFPSLADLLEPAGGGEAPRLPASIEITPRSGGAPAAAVGEWIAAMRRNPAVETVDDDRDWLSSLDTAIALVRGGGLLIGGVLLGAAIFTIASVIRLTAFLYQEEIAVMRLVGATEFFIRGPFYAEGLLQGLLGGSLAAGGLWLALRAAAPELTGLLAQALSRSALGWPQGLALVALGSGAGLLGAVVSLRREDLGRGEAG